MPPPFRVRFPLGEMTRLGPQIDGAAKKHASDNPSLLKVAGDLAETSGKLGSLTRPGAPSVLDADFARDELVRALATGIESQTHRVDVPDRRAAAIRLQPALFADGFAWVNAALGVESARIAKLLMDAASPTNAADLIKLGLGDCTAALAKRQVAFLDAERGRGAAAGAGIEVTKEGRKLMARFNRKLDVYVSRVEDEYGEEAKDAQRIADLLQPLVDATAREHAQEGPRSGGPTPPPKSP